MIEGSVERDNRTAFFAICVFSGARKSINEKDFPAAGVPVLTR